MRPVFTLSGLSPAVADLFAPRLAALGLASTSLGGSTTGLRPPVSFGDQSVHALLPGSAVAVALATGDITLAGTGTVSNVDGPQHHGVWSSDAFARTSRTAHVCRGDRDDPPLLQPFGESREHRPCHRNHYAGPPLRRIRRVGGRSGDDGCGGHRFVQQPANEEPSISPSHVRSSLRPCSWRRA